MLNLHLAYIYTYKYKLIYIHTYICTDLKIYIDTAAVEKSNRRTAETCLIKCFRLILFSRTYQQQKQT